MGCFEGLMRQLENFIHHGWEGPRVQCIPGLREVSQEEDASEDLTD